MNKNEIVEIIQKEIVWHLDNPMVEDITPEHRDGFLAGLRQAQYLIKSVGVARENQTGK